MSYRYSTPRPILKKIITNNEFYDLLAEEHINPRGEERADLRSAMICTTIARSVGSKTAKITDYQLKFDESTKKDTPQEISMKLKMLSNMVKRAGK